MSSNPISAKEPESVSETAAAYMHQRALLVDRLIAFCGYADTTNGSTTIEALRADIAAIDKCIAELLPRALPLAEWPGTICVAPGGRKLMREELIADVICAQIEKAGLRTGRGTADDPVRPNWGEMIDWVRLALASAEQRLSASA